MRLLECFHIGPETRVISLVGAGGKTSLMYALAREIVSLGRTVVTTTTTKICPPDLDQSPSVLFTCDDPELRDLSARLAEFGHVTVVDSVHFATGKAEGIPHRLVQQCAERALHVLVEADGAAGRFIKAPEEWEPVIPPTSRLVIPVVGLGCLGRHAEEDVVFRLSRFTELTGLARGDIVTPESVARLLTHLRGGLKGVPETSAAIPFLNQVATVPDRNTVEETARRILAYGRKKITRVVAGTLLQPRGPGETCPLEVYSSEAVG